MIESTIHIGRHAHMPPDDYIEHLNLEVAHMPEVRDRIRDYAARQGLPKQCDIHADVSIHCDAHRPLSDGRWYVEVTVPQPAGEPHIICRAKIVNDQDIAFLEQHCGQQDKSTS